MRTDISFDDSKKNKKTTVVKSNNFIKRTKK